MVNDLINLKRFDQVYYTSRYIHTKHLIKHKSRSYLWKQVRIKIQQQMAKRQWCDKQHKFSSWRDEITWAAYGTYDLLIKCSISDPSVIFFVLDFLLNIQVHTLHKHTSSRANYADRNQARWRSLPYQESISPRFILRKSILISFSLDFCSDLSANNAISYR